jgi:hypothetical protein
MAQQTHKLQFTASTGGQAGDPISGFVSEVGTSWAGPLRVNVPANSLDYPVALSFPVAGLQTFVAWSDKGCTLKCNGATGTVSFDLQPGVPYWWFASSGTPSPFAEDITGATVTNGAACQLKVTGVIA